MIQTRISEWSGTDATPSAKSQVMLDEESDLALFYRVLQEFPDAFLAVQKAMESRRPKPAPVECPHCEKTFVPGEPIQKEKQEEP